MGINQSSPIAILDVNGNLVVGSSFSGILTAPQNGALIQGKLGIGTASVVKTVTIETPFSDGIYFRGNTSGLQPFTAATITLEANRDYRGRGMFMPHRDTTDLSPSSWFCGVAYTGEGFQIGNSTIHSFETMGGPYDTVAAKFFIKEDGNTGIGTRKPDAKLEVHGDVKLGQDGTLYSASAEENLRITRGNVTSSGTITAGSGYTISQLNTGHFRINFDTPFVSTPTIVATHAGGSGGFAIVTVMTTTYAEVQIRSYDSHGLLAGPFTFIAAGPR